ncbi:MAG: malectin [Limisphaerales bacterium]
MRNTKQAAAWLGGASTSVLAALLLAGCQSTKEPAPAAQAQPTMPAVAAPEPTAAATPMPAPADPNKPQPTIRVKAGLTETFKDAEGNTWLPDQGFRDGDTSTRADLKIANTTDPSLYTTERYGMTSFTYPVRNGKYLVKLYFAETYEGITGPGQRVFSFNVQGHEFKDVDIWVKAGGPLRAYVETVPVEVTDGNVHITFTPNVENPEINGIEIIPQP